MTTIKEYFAAQKELEKKYGEFSLVLMQVGSFYEAYGVNLPNETVKTKIGYTEEIGDILSMQVAYKNGRKKPHSLENPQMVGFPDYALGNHLGKLLKAGFTVGIYDQFDSENAKTKIRKLVHIYSSSTYIDEEISESNALMVLDLACYKCPISKKTIDTSKCAIFNLKTGDINLIEIYNTPTDDKRIETELYRIIHTFNPSEIINTTNLDFLANRFDLENKKVHNIPFKKQYKQLAYQNEFLEKIYELSDNEMSANAISPVEYLGLSKHSELVPCLIHGLEYVFEHDPLLISKIKIPTIMQNQDKLILNNDSIYQLHLIDNKVDNKVDNNVSKTSLFGFLNKTRTAMGRRMLKSRLLMPVTNIKELNRRYSLVSNLLETYEEYDTTLRGIADLELKYRKMASKKLKPYELANLNDTFISIKNLLEKAKDVFSIENAIIDSFNSFYDDYLNTFDLEILKESKIKNSYFNPGICSEIDEIQTTITTNTDLLNELASEISMQIDKKQNATPNVTLDFNMNDKHYLKSTLVRFNKIPKSFNCELSDGTNVQYKDFEINKLKTNVKIKSPFIIEKSREITEAQDILIPTINAQYLDMLDSFCKLYGDTFMTISNIIAEIDFTMSAAKVAVENKYSRPKIVKSERSFINAVSLRHPIVEKLVKKTIYVNNNVEIGVDTHYGTIIYGVNMAGKSSLLRSIGIAVVMAQAGMYTASESFKYYPFKSIISKITIQDNYLKGQSLFMVEMEEVNNMLRRADHRTLILSDELCSSTETSSAHAIVACTLNQLADKKVNFVFSTHLHELQKIPEIKNNPNIQVMHFKVTVGNGEMIFDRKLQKGGIPDTYGLEIAGSLGLPKDFIADAFRIRNFLREGVTKNEVVTTKSSRYNKELFMDKCALCGTNKCLETHHILFQCCADSNGIINAAAAANESGPIHKNQKFNLIVVCQDCHIRIHKEEVKVKIEPLKIKV